MTELEKALSQIAEDEELQKIFSDPVYFTKIMLDMTPRWYQKIILRDPNNKKVIRAGRRIGKTASMIMKILFTLYTNEDTKVLVVAPLNIQINPIFKEIRKLIEDNELLKQSVTRSIKSPQTIELSNGSSVIGLSAGSSSGSSANNTRGQGADLIILDECDFLAQEDLNSIMGTQLADMGNVEIWSASTPKGARSTFYKWCKSAKETYTIKSLEDRTPIKKVRQGKTNGWTQFHFPSHVNPTWSDDDEEELRELFSELGYIHEVLAEFGDNEAGVYKNQYIDQAAYDYSYKDAQEREVQPDNVRIIGVDWDLKVSTQIVISEFNRKEKKIQLIDREEIEPAEFTFDNAVNTILALDRKYNADFIYVDRGYGEYQKEVLKKKLGKKVRGIQFSEKLEVQDPFDGSIEKKETKYFMVTQTAILLERGQIMLSKHDQEFLDQLRNYRIVKYTSSGKPIYNDDNEHVHDAFALTILAFNREFPDLTALLDSFEQAKDVEFVNKKLHEFGNILADRHTKDQETYGISKEEAKKLEDEPDYVKHMMAIEFNRNKGRSDNSWGSRGHDNRRSPGRKTF